MGTLTAQRVASGAAVTEPLAPKSAPAKIVALPPRMAPMLRLSRQAGAVFAQVLPPLFMLAVLLAIWEAATSGPNSGLPSPSRVWLDSHELIMDPFFDRGGVD